MDYYYALLNSYELLKQRRFKLSLREEEEEDSSEEENVQKLIAAGAGATDREGAIVYPGSNVSLYQADTGSIMAADKDDLGPQGQAQWVPIVDKDGKKGKVPTAIKYWSYIFGGKKPEPPSSTKKEGPLELRGMEDAETNPKVAAKQQEVVNLLDKLHESDYISKDELTTLMGQAKGQTMGTRVGADVASEMATMGTDKKPADIMTSLEGQLTFLTAYQKLRTPGGDPITAEEVKTLRTQILVTPNGVRFGAEGKGALYRQYRRDATAKNDAYIKMADELNKVIEQQGEAWEGLDKKNPFKPLPKKDRPPSEKGGEMRALRGIIGEKLEKTNIAITKMEVAQKCLDETPTDAGCQKRFDEAVESAQKTFGEAMKKYIDPVTGEVKEGASREVMLMFDRGNQTILGNHFANAADMDDAEFVDGIKEILIDPNGPHKLDKDSVDALITLGGQKNGVGLVLVIVATRQFSQDLYPEDGIMPDDIIQTGQEGGQHLGEKADLIAEYDLPEDGNCDAVRDDWENKLNPEQKKHYDTLKSCVGDGDNKNAMKGIGIDTLATKEEYPEAGADGKAHPKAGKSYCAVRQELKIVDDKGKKVSYGEGTSTRYNKICNAGKEGGEKLIDKKTGKETKTASFLKLHEARMKCFAGKDVGKNGCAKQKEIEEDFTVSASRMLLNPKTAAAAVEKGPDGKPVVKQAALDYLNNWGMARSGGLDDDGITLQNFTDHLSVENKTRYKAAMYVLKDPSLTDNNPDTGDPFTPDEKKKYKDHLNKIQLEIENEVISEKMKTDDSGNLEGDSLDYMCNRLSITGGSTDETVKVGRKLAERIQTVGLNNAEIYATIAGLKATPPTLWIKKSGNTYNVVNADGAKRFKISMERGRIRLVSDSAIGNVISQPSKASEDPKEEHLLMSFLRGQANLLEKLINQTT